MAGPLRGQARDRDDAYDSWKQIEVVEGGEFQSAGLSRLQAYSAGREPSAVPIVLYRASRKRAVLPCV